MFSFFKKKKDDLSNTKCEKNLSESQEKSVASVMIKTGWDRQKTIAEIEKAKQRIEITYKDYDRYDFYKIPDSEQGKKYEQILKKREHLKEEKQKAIAAVVQKTDWDATVAEKRISEARHRTGCAYKEYVTYKFYELDEELQNSLFLIIHSKKIAKKYDTNKKFVKMLTNKELTNECFSEYLKRPWGVNTKLSEEEFERTFANSKRIIYKPISGNRGKGVQAFDVNNQTLHEVYDSLKDMPEGVIEEYVVQHPELSALSPTSVNTLRIVMIASNSMAVTADGKKVDIAYAALRIGGGHSIIDNFHGGGMVAAVDLNTGTLVTGAADMEGNHFDKHPVTGREIKGFSVPFFKEALDMVQDAQRKSGIEGYLGWDIAITETGPVLIEINLRPGAVLLTAPYVAEGKGTKHFMEKYL